MSDDHATRIAILEERTVSLKEIVGKSATEKDHDDLKGRIEKLETNQRWVTLMVIGSVIAALLRGLGLQ